MSPNFPTPPPALSSPLFIPTHQSSHPSSGRFFSPLLSPIGCRRSQSWGRETALSCGRGRGQGSSAASASPFRVAALLRKAEDEEEEEDSSLGSRKRTALEARHVEEEEEGGEIREWKVVSVAEGVGLQRSVG